MLKNPSLVAIHILKSPEIHLLINRRSCSSLLQYQKIYQPTKCLLLKGSEMRALITVLFLIFVLPAHSAEQRIYQKDSAGNVQHHKPSYTVEPSGRIVETDSVGNKQYHKQQYQMKDGKVYQSDSVGNIQYHKPGFVIKDKK